MCLLHSNGEPKYQSGAIAIFLLAELPEYMLPSRYTKLDHMPYTANGKLDRKALPDPLLLQGEGTDTTLPRNALEQLLAELWSDLLQLKEIDVHARFFEIGGIH